MKYFCHPAIEKWLAQARVKMKYLRNNVGQTFITSYQFQQKDVHSGLQEAIKFRLTHPSYYPIILLSFYSKEVLKNADAFGILSLTGTEYLQLPVPMEVLYETIESCNEKFKDVELSITEAEWEKFSIPAFKSLIKSIIAKVVHDINGVANKNAIGNTAVNPLAAACRGLLNNPAYLPVVSNCISNFQNYLEAGHFAELIALSLNAPADKDEFLLSVSNVCNELKRIAGYQCNSAEDASIILDNIEKLDVEETLKKIITN